VINAGEFGCKGGLLRNYPKKNLMATMNNKKAIKANNTHILPL